MSNQHSQEILLICYNINIIKQNIRKLRVISDLVLHSLTCLQQTQNKQNMSTSATAATPTATTTNTATLTTVSLVNLIGILVSVILVLMYLIFSGHAMKYIKTFACKIKIISNRVEDKNIQLKDYNYQPQRQQVRATPGYQQMEAVFKNEIKKSRSLQFKNILGAYMAKYNHVAHYPFRDRLADKVDLLKPKSTFFNLIVVTQLCIVWMITILLSAILQNVYTDISSVAVGTFIGLTVVISAIAAALNMLQINRMQHLYVLNIKNAFKSEREQYKFVPLNDEQDALREFSPDNSWDEAEFQKHLEEMQMSKAGTKGHQRQQTTITSRTMTRDENMATMHTSRKLLITEDNYKNNTLKKNFNVPKKNVIQEDNEGEEYDYEEPGYSQHSAMKLRSPHQSQDYQIYDVNENPSQFKKRATTRGGAGKFDLNAAISQIESKYDKYAFIEDTHAVGEHNLLSNEANKGENKANVLTFGIIFIIIAVACITCCYLNYTFPALLSKYIFYMALGAFFMDMLLFRMLTILLMAAIKYLVAKRRGYQKVQYKRPEEVRQLLGTALRDMLIKPKNSHDLKSDAASQLKHKQRGVSVDEYEDQTEGQYERNDTTSKNINLEENKEDEYALEIDENGFQKTDHFGPTLKTGKQESYISNNPLMKEDDIPSEHTLKQTQGGPQLTHFSLLKNLSGKPEQEHAQLMDKKQLVNELADYNLMLFRMIYDAYDERGERVIRKFRSDDHGVLRKRFMTPVMNPNFDHDEWLKNQMKNQKIEENGAEFEDVLPGEQDFSGKDSHQIEPTRQELVDDPKANKVERLHIDKFGNLLSEKPSELQIVLPQPAFGVISLEKELESAEEDADEWSKKKKELEMLRAKKKVEKLSNEESKRLTELETEEDVHRHKEIEELESLGERKTDEQNLLLKNLLKEEQDYRNRRIQELQDQEKKTKLSEEEKKELNMLLEWQKDQKQKLLDELREKRKNGKLTDEEARMLKQLEEEEWNAKKSELEELREKLKRGTITDEERKRLAQLEEEEIARNRSELDELLQKLKNGTITEEERKRLKELQEWEQNLKNKQLEELRQKLKNGSLSEEERRLLEQLEEEEKRVMLSELEMLRLKKERGELTEEERKRLEELEEWAHKQRMSEIEQLKNKQNKSAEEILKLKQLLAEEDIRVDNQLNELYEKMARGEKLTEEELRKLKELEDYKYKRLVDQIEELKALGDDISDEDKLKLLFLQRELVKLELEQLRRKNPPLSEEDQARLKLLEENFDKLDYEYLLLKQKIGTLTDEELERLRELEAKLKMNDLSQIDKGDDSQMFEEEGMLNGDQHLKTEQEEEESYFKTEEAESRITDNDNFADLPPVEVIGSIKKPKSSESQRLKGEKLNQQEIHKEEEAGVEQRNENYSFKKEEQVVGAEEKVDEKTYRSSNSTTKKEVQFKQIEQEEQDINSERFGLAHDEKLLKKGEKGYKEQQKRIKEAKQKYLEKQKEMESLRKKSCSEYGLNENERLLEKGEDGYEEQQERIQTAKTGLRNDEKILNQGEKGYEEQQERIKTAQAKYRDHLKYEDERLGLEEGEQVLQPGQPGFEEQQERIKTAKNGGLKEGEKLLKEGEKGYEEQQERMKAAERHSHIHDSKHPDQAEELNRSSHNSSRAGLREGEKLLKKGEKGYEEQQERIKSAKSNLDNQNQQQHMNDRSLDESNKQGAAHAPTDQELNSEEQLRQLSSRASNRQLQDRVQSAKSRQSMQNRSSHMLNNSQGSNMNVSGVGLNDGEKMLKPGEAGFEQQQDRIKSAISQQRSQLQSALSGLRDGERLLNPGEVGYDEQQLRLQQSHRSGRKEIMSEQERIKSAISGNRSQARLDSEGNLVDMQMRPPTASSRGTRNLNNQSRMDKSARSSQMNRTNDSQKQHMKKPHAPGMENYDRLNEDDMMEFGHDDLEMVRAPAGQDMHMVPDESIYSHKTSTILDEEKVSFMHIEHLPDQDNASDDSFAEQDMVYYNKDDLTNYSKGLGLNKVKAKPLPQYYSENDIQEENEGVSFSGGEETMNAADESRSWDPSRKKIGGRGRIQHNDLEVQSYNDQIDGRLKVDSWNLNYNSKKKKHRKRKIDESVQRRMNALQDIYGVDAKSLAGIRTKPTAPLITGGTKSNKDGNLGTSRASDNMSFRSTQNSMFKPNATKNNLRSKGSAMEVQSNMFSSIGFTGKAGNMRMSKRWNDIESTLKGGKIGGAGDNNRSQNNLALKQHLSPNSKQGQQFGGAKKLTSTQQKFVNMNDPYNMQEESKSRSNSNNNRQLKKRPAASNALNKQNQGKNKGDYDDYSESDEGVNDQGVLFQKRDGPPSKAWANEKASPMKNQNTKKGKQTIIDNEIAHDESDEGVNDNDPDFEGNNPLFQRRDFDMSHQINQKKHKTMKINKNGPSFGNKGSAAALGRNSSQGSDLEKGAFGAAGRGRQGTESGNRGQFGRTSNASENGKSISPTKPPLGGAARAGGRQLAGGKGSHGDSGVNKRMMRTDGSGGRIGAVMKQNNNQKAIRSNGFSDGGGGGSKNRGIDVNSVEDEDDGDDDDQFIVGPESNHSMLKSRGNLGKQKRNSLDDQNVDYLSISKNNQQRQGAYDSSQSPDKKRKVRRAAHSTSDADREFNRLQALRNERLKKSQMQAEGALFNKQGSQDGGTDADGLARKKRKKQQKNSVRKEVNYWLDYDSPYAEYLVARFREWSPNVKPVQARPGDLSDRQHSQGKYKEIQNVYAGSQDSRHNLSSAHKKNSVSPHRNPMNMTSNSIGNESAQVMKDKRTKHAQKKASSKNTQEAAPQRIPRGHPSQIPASAQNFFHEVEDYEEP